LSVLPASKAGQRSFYEDDDFEPFDVVIVDEVSKATPTELLMPMMLGRKVILVGDQRQLPPMLKEKESSFTEALEEGLIQAEDFERFRNLITTSFFGNLFENADKSVRQSLFDHYRSQEQIVATFNPFYDGRLVIAGGAETLNRLRQHHLAIKDRNGGWFLEPHQHVLWIDSSRRANGKVFTERQSGSSKVNLLEIDLIIASLMRLNWGLRGRGYGPLKTAEAKSRQNGLSMQNWVRQLLPRAKNETIADLFARQQVRIDGHVAPADHIVKTKNAVTIDARMAIGIITFYGAQLGRIRKKIADVNDKDPCYLDACNLQSNTVDKFQGKEMPIVIVSLVRAPEHRHVGRFVKEYRRINVAFSRIQGTGVVHNIVSDGVNSSFRIRLHDQGRGVHFKTTIALRITGDIVSTIARHATPLEFDGRLRRSQKPSPFFDEHVRNRFRRGLRIRPHIDVHPDRSGKCRYVSLRRLADTRRLAPVAIRKGTVSSLHRCHHLFELCLVPLNLFGTLARRVLNEVRRLPLT